MSKSKTLALKAQENSLIWQLSLQNISRRTSNRLQRTCSRNCNKSRATKLITFFCSDH